MQCFKLTCSVSFWHCRNACGYGCCPSMCVLACAKLSCPRFTFLSCLQQYVPLFLTKEDLDVAVSGAYRQRNAAQISAVKDKVRLRFRRLRAVTTIAHQATKAVVHRAFAVCAGLFSTAADTGPGPQHVATWPVHARQHSRTDQHALSAQAFWLTAGPNASMR
jgi:hypothetical protein